MEAAGTAPKCRSVIGASTLKARASSARPTLFVATTLKDVGARKDRLAVRVLAVPQDGGLAGAGAEVPHDAKELARLDVIATLTRAGR